MRRMKTTKNRDGEYRITMPYACYSILVKNNFIVMAPPIAEWARGQTLEEFIKWVELKGGIAEKTNG